MSLSLSLTVRRRSHDQHNAHRSSMISVTCLSCLCCFHTPERIQHHYTGAKCGALVLTWDKFLLEMVDLAAQITNMTGTMERGGPKALLVSPPLRAYGPLIHIEFAFEPSVGFYKRSLSVGRVIVRWLFAWRRLWTAGRIFAIWHRRSRCQPGLVGTLARGVRV